MKKPQILSTLFPQTSPVVEPEVSEQKKKEEEDEKKEHDKSWKRMKLGYLLNVQCNIDNCCEIFRFDNIFIDLQFLRVWCIVCDCRCMDCR